MISGATYFVIGILVAIFGIIGSLSGATVTLSGPFRFSGSGPTVMMISLLYPFISAIAGFIGGFIFAWFYNFIIGFTKGLSLEYREQDRFDI
jgi:hypothetical protein